MMKMLVLLTVLGTVLHDTTAGIHSLKYFYTASSGVPDFPAYVSVGYVNDIPISQCNSNTNRNEPKEDWMIRATADEPNHWQRRTERCLLKQQVFKANIEIAKQRFNQTGGVHLVQVMYGCEWDDQTEIKAVTGFYQFGYDGEDFIALDLQTQTWIAPTPQAVITKHKLDKDKGIAGYWKNYLTKECPGWVKKYVDYGRSSLMRTDLPSVSFLQKTSSSPITCHATGFYPNNAMMFWRKDGEELQENVDVGEILPNPDGSFQMSVDLKPPESSADWGRYECVFQLSGVKEDQVYRLDKKEILTNEVNQTNKIIIIVAVLLVALFVISGVVGFIMWNKRNSNCDQSADSGSELSEKLNKEPR